MKKNLKWLLIVLSAVFLIGMISGLVFVYRFDLNTYKPQIEKIVFEHTGRKLSLGDIRLKISWTPTLRIKQISFADADWGKRRSMVEAKEADVSVAIMPLFVKAIVIDDIKLIQPEIYLSVNENSRKNWSFESSASETEKKTPETNNGFMSDVKVTVKKISVSDGVIVYDSPKSKSNLQIKRAFLKPEKNRVFLDYDLLYNGREVKGTMKGDALDSFLIKEGRYNAEIEAEALKCRLKTSVALTNVSGDWHIEGNLDLTSPEGNFNLPTLRLKSNVSADQKSVSLGIEQLAFGKSIIHGDVKVFLTEKPDIRAQIITPLLDISFLFPTKEDGSEKVSSASDAPTGDFLPDRDLRLDFLNLFDTRSVFDIARLVINQDLSLDKVNGSVVVKNGVLNLKDVSFIAGRGTVKSGLSLNAAGNAVKIDLDGSGIVLSDLIKSLKPKEKNFSFKKGGIAHSHIALKTKGKSYRDLFENLEGQVLLAVGQSNVHFGLLKYVQGNFLTQLISALNVSTKQTDASLKCAVIRADFEKKKVQFPKGIAFDSDQIKLVGDGSVSLTDNKIDILVQPLSGDLMKTNVTQILASMIKVTGTLMEPSVAVNSQSVIKNAVGVAAGGAIFIGTKLLLDSDANPCRTALQGTVYEEMYPKTTGIKAGMQRAYQKTFDTLEKTAETIVDSGTNVGQAVQDTAQKGMDTVNKATKSFLNLFGD